MGKIRVAIVGVGNCASALVQGVHYYKDAVDDELVPGLMHVRLGPYHVGDIEFVAAFDIDKNKVGKDLAEAIYTPPNCTIKVAEVPKLKVEVMRGMTHDSIGKYLQDVVVKDRSPTVDVAEVLKETGTDVMVNFLPVGSESATKWYVEQALEARTGVVNGIPVFIAREKRWQDIFTKRGVPICGDDVKSQVGATILHRTLINLLVERGVKVERTYQLNFGGNTDFLNMLERERLASKKESKTHAVTSLLPYQLNEGDVHIGPSDYVPWLTDRKWAYIRLEGKGFGDTPLSIETKLEVWDSPNSAGVVIDAIRCVKIAKDRGVGGPLISASAYLMKSPPQQFPDHVAKKMLEEFIEGRRER
ncbi:MAG: inositol-3-phosphate synthase [Aigarchaeota archaeon]|nr:inositol-3-phosphate synthase [Aigarchaeota archaeon]MDW8092619.1 inositol-3-phosphate synthase [Nitrososphaerota archaeon]